MKMKQILVNFLIVAAMTVLAFFCYANGKANTIFVENSPFDHEGVTYEAFEAVQVTAAGSDSHLFLLAGERGTVTLIGRSHVLLIEELDENNNITAKHSINFKKRELKGNIVNIVPLLNGKIPGWSYSLN